MDMGRGACVIAGVAILGLLTGCALIDGVSRTGGSIVDAASISGALDTAKQELESIDGVRVTQSESEIQADYSYRVTLVASADSPLSEDGALRAMEAARALFASDPLKGRPGTFQLTSESTPLSLEGSSVSAEQLAREVDYYFDLVSAYGAPLGLSISSQRDEAGAEVGYVRGIRSLGGGLGDPSALDDVSDTTTGTHEWELAGLGASGSLPGSEVFALLDSVSEIAPIVDYASMDEFTGVHLQWSGATRTVDVGLVSADLDVGAPLATSASIDVARQVVDLSIASGAPLSQFSFSADDGSVFAVVAFSQCGDGETQATPLDRELAAALAPTPVYPGFCQP